MPLSLDEATRLYESYVQNIQDGIFTIESLMGASFNFNITNLLGNLDHVDINKEEKNVATQIQVLQEYKEMMSNEKKRRSMQEGIQSSHNFKDFKMQLRTKRRSDRVSTNPYDKFKQPHPVVNEEQ